jgi:fibronectin type 3 domain-containing protein
VRSVAQSNSGVIESADSNPVVVSAKDVFPPAVPQGLEVVINPATPAAAPSIELVWAIGTEPDLAGYAVYRSEQPDDVGTRVSTELLPVPAFRDTTVLPGRQYFYRVRAIDRAGNESALSAPVAVQIPAP